MSAVDQTGKTAGKRVLEDGIWKAVSSLPQAIQDEIKANTHMADKKRMQKALSNNKEYVDLQNEKATTALKSENDDLKAMIAEQGAMLAKLNAKMELGALPVVEKAVAKGVAEVIVKKPTKKESLQMECESRGIEFEEDTTIKTLKEFIDAHDIDMFDNDLADKEA